MTVARSQAHVILEAVTSAIDGIRAVDGYHHDWHTAERYDGEREETAGRIPYCSIWMGSKVTIFRSTSTDVEELVVNGRAILSDLERFQFDTLDEIIESATQDVYRVLRALSNTQEFQMEALRFDAFHEIGEKEEIGFGLAATFRYNVDQDTEAEA